MDEVVDIFDRKRVDYELETIGEHSRANVVFARDNRQYEFRIVDTPVSNLIAEGIENGQMRVLAA